MANGKPKAAKKAVHAVGGGDAGGEDQQVATLTTEEPDSGWVYHVVAKSIVSAVDGKASHDLLVDSGAFTHVAPQNFARHLPRDESRHVLAFGPDLGPLRARQRAVPNPERWAALRGRLQDRVLRGHGHDRPRQPARHRAEGGQALLPEGHVHRPHAGGMRCGGPGGGGVCAGPRIVVYGPL